MLIPKDISNRKFKEGDIVVILQDIDRDYYTITKGHEMVYMGTDDWGPVLLEPETGKIVRKALRLKEFTHKVSFTESTKINTNVKDKRKYLKFILDNCPKKGQGFYDRDTYISCKLIKRIYFSNDECKCKFECFEHIPESKYKNNSFILNYNRKIKLKKLKKLSIDNEQE